MLLLLIFLVGGLKSRIAMATELGVFEHRDIRVELNRRRYVTGDLLRGRVLFRTTKFVKSSEFVVRLEGREHISWLEQSSTTSTSQTRPRRRHNKDVLRERVRIHCRVF